MKELSCETSDAHDIERSVKRKEAERQDGRMLWAFLMLAHQAGMHPDSSQTAVRWEG